MANKDEAEKDEGEKSALDMLKSSNKGVVKCRICKEDHWTTNCPYKETLGPLRESLAGKDPNEEGGADGEAAPGGAGGGGPGGATGGGGGASGPGGKYVPPSRRGEAGAAQRLAGESMPDRRRSKTPYPYSIRVCVADSVSHSSTNALSQLSNLLQYEYSFKHATCAIMGF